MENIGIGAGLAALAFWGFVAVAVLAGVWDNIRKRDAQHETIRRLLDSGQPLDPELMEKLSLVSHGEDVRHDQAFQVTGLWVLPVAVGMLAFGLILGAWVPDAMGPLVGISALLGCMGIGFLIAAKFTARWYLSDDDAAG